MFNCPPRSTRAKAQHACVLRPPERGGAGCKLIMHMEEPIAWAYYCKLIMHMGPVALSSGRAEWGGLVMVLVIATGVSAAIELRLCNLQVVNTFNDGEWKYRRNWLRRNGETIGTWQC